MFRPKKIYDTIKAVELFVGGVAVGFALKEIITSETFENIKTELTNSINFNEEDMQTVDINTDDNTTDNSTKTTKTSLKTQLKEDEQPTTDKK